MFCETLQSDEMEDFSYVADSQKRIQFLQLISLLCRVFVPLLVLGLV